jgi:hypothetical protein
MAAFSTLALLGLGMVGGMQAARVLGPKTRPHLDQLPVVTGPGPQGPPPPAPPPPPPTAAAAGATARQAADEAAVKRRRLAQAGSPRAIPRPRLSPAALVAPVTLLGR